MSKHIVTVYWLDEEDGPQQEDVGTFDTPKEALAAKRALEYALQELTALDEIDVRARVPVWE